MVEHNILSTPLFTLSFVMWTHYALPLLITSVIILAYMKVKGIKLQPHAEKLLGALLIWVHLIAPPILGLMLYPYLSLMSYATELPALAAIAVLMFILALLPRETIIHYRYVLIALSVLLATVAVIVTYVGIAAIASSPVIGIGIRRLALLLAEGDASEALTLCFLDTAVLVGFDVAVYRCIKSREG